MCWKSKIRKDIDKIGENICEETQVSDTPAEEEKFKIGEKSKIIREKCC